jgi:hypothetical protein
MHCKHPFTCILLISKTIYLFFAHSHEEIINLWISLPKELPDKHALQAPMHLINIKNKLEANTTIHLHFARSLEEIIWI